MRFVDTNVLVYAVSAADEEAAKRDQALNVLAARDLALSVQVLQEFYVQATRDAPDNDPVEAAAEPSCPVLLGVRGS